MGDERGIVGRVFFKRNVVEASLKVNHAYPFRSSKLGPVASRVVQLVLVLLGSLVDRYYILAYAVGLA